MEQIRANRRRSVTLVVVMGLVLAGIGFAAGELLAGPGAGVPGILVAGIVWAVILLVYVFAGESILLGTANAREIKPEDSPRLVNIVDEMKLASGLPFRPRIYLIDDPAPNAFAIGRTPESSALAVTTGLLQRLSRDEIQGVVGHEIGHLKNRDTQFLTLAAATLGTIVVLSEFVRRSLWFGGGRSRQRDSARGGDSGGGQLQLILLVVSLVFVILGPILAQVLYFACSRKREYLADASSALFTRYPEGLASALDKISQARTTVGFASQVTAPMFIVNPLYAHGAEPTSFFATHPPTSERIRILRSMAGAGLQEYEQAYRQSAHGSVIGSHSLAAATPEPIRPPSPAEPLESRQDVRNLISRANGYIRLKCAGCGLECSVPEGFERDEINCIRCGTTMPLPKAEEFAAVASAPPPFLTAATGAPAAASGLQYTRTGSGWESFRCACGRTVQVSPAFRAPQIKCLNCGRTIQIVGAPSA